MLEAFGIPFGTVAQLLIVIFSGGTFAAVLTYVVRNRAITVGAEETLRTHFGAELKRLAEEAERAAQRQLKCEDREEQLRKRVRDLEKSNAAQGEEIKGLKRQIARYSSDRLMILEDRLCPTDKAPEAVKSARRVKAITERDDK
jgi:hypothetical protein